MAAAAAAGGMNAAIQGLGQLTTVAQESLVRGLSKEGRALNRQNRDDIDRLKRNAFGPSKAEQEAATQDAAAMGAVQAQAARAEAARRMAAQSFRAPDSTAAAITANQAAQTGQLRMQESNLAAQQAQQAKLDALARIKARSAKTSADVRSIGDAGREGFNSGMGGGGGGGGSAPDYSKLRAAYGSK